MGKLKPEEVKQFAQDTMGFEPRSLRRQNSELLTAVLSGEGVGKADRLSLRSAGGSAPPGTELSSFMGFI